MGFRESIERESGYRTHDCVLRFAVMPFLVMPSRRRASIAFIRSFDLLNPIARRNSSASPPVKLAATIAIRSNCS